MEKLERKSKDTRKTHLPDTGIIAVQTFALTTRYRTTSIRLRAGKRTLSSVLKRVRLECMGCRV
jgi:hypothetical protein